MLSWILSLWMRWRGRDMVVTGGDCDRPDCESDVFHIVFWPDPDTARVVCAKCEEIFEIEFDPWHADDASPE